LSHDTDRQEFLADINAGASLDYRWDHWRLALEIANSPNIGVCLCCGSWLEGGKMTGKDTVEMIRYFGGMRKLFKIHFRNVSAPLPHFTGTMIDDGQI
jgi:mannonate dehydratase